MKPNNLSDERPAGSEILDAIKEKTYSSGPKPEAGGSMVEHALAYARLGYRIHPLHEPLGSGQCSCQNRECKGVGKHPRLSGWPDKATTDPDVIRGWWAKWPTANIGIAGTADLNILDVDPGGAETLRTKYGLDVAALAATTPSVRTARDGYHLYFRAPPGRSQKNSVKALGDGLDVRAVGGYVVAPPSSAPTGTWRWLTGPEAPLAPWPVELQMVEEGGRDNALISQCGYWLSLGKGEDELGSLAHDWNAEHNAPPLAEREVEKCVKSALKLHAEKGSGGVSLAVLYSDVGNGRRLATAVAQELRFCPPLDRWVGWNNRHWEWDTRRELLARQRAKMFTDRELAAATDAKIKGTRPQADEHITAILRLYGEGRFGPMLKNAKDDPIVRVSAAAFDRQPYLLNVADGTLDLRTLELRPFSKADLLTGALAVPYVTDAVSDIWTQHIRYLAATSDGTPRPELEAFYWRALGYTLLGNNPERVLFFLKGRTTAGKSMLQEGVRALFGSLAGSLGFHSLLKASKLRGGGDTPRPDLVQLLGKRFVTAGEPNPDGEFDVALIKQLTGGDALRLRTLYAEPIEFVFGGKLWLAANNPPKIEAADEAIWRRVLVLPVEYTIPPDLRDDTILAKLTTPETLTGLLAMMVRGLRDWRERGERLAPPAMVTFATTTYREENDLLTQFLEARCRINEPRTKRAGVAHVKLAKVFDGFRTYCEGLDRPCPVSTPRGLAEPLRDLGFEVAKGTDSVTFVYGLSFAAEEPPPPDVASGY